MSETHKGKIEVKLDSMLRLLADSLYTRPDVCIRELLANATDALHARQFALGAGEGDGLEIRIWYDGAATLTVQDTGLGMTREEILKYLTVIGESGTRILRESIKERELVRKLIGQFGIGLLSSFSLAEKVEILTLSARHPDAQGFRWVCRPDGGYELTEVNLPQPGTTVRLHIGDRIKRQLVTGEHLEASVKRYGDFLPFPIRDNMGRQLNIQVPPWEKPAATEEDYARYIAHRFGWDRPYFFIPITPQPGHGIEMGGIVFIPSQRAFLNRNGAVDLYVKHMLVRQDCPNVLPDYLLFLAGIVECPELTMIVSREDVMRNSIFERFQKALTAQVVTRLGELARGPATLRNVMASHGRELKAALLQDEDLFRLLAPHIPFHSGATGRSVTLADYMASAARRKEADEQRRIYYYTGAGAGITRFQVNQVMAARGIDVLEIVDDAPGASLDLRILQKFAADNQAKLSDAEERDDLFPQVSGWETVEALFASIIPSMASRRASVRTTSFAPKALPLLVFNPKHRGLKDSIKQLSEQVNDTSGVLQQLIRLASARMQEEEDTTILLLNADNEEMRLLRERVSAKIAPLVAIELYNLAMEYSGYVWEGPNLDVVRAQRQRILSVCLRGAEELDPYVE